MCIPSNDPLLAGLELQESDSSLFAGLELDLDASERMIDESERLRAEVAEDLDEARRRERRNEKRKKKRAQQAKQRQQVEETLAANQAVAMGRELLERHSDQRTEDEHRTLIDDVRKQEVEFFDLFKPAKAESSSTKPTNAEVERLEDRIQKHKAKTAHEKDAYERFEAENKRRDEELASKDAKENQAKAAFAALKAKKAQRKARSKSPKRSPRMATSGPAMKRQLTP